MKIDSAKAKSVAVSLCIIGVAFWVGFMSGFFNATGGLPFDTGGEDVLPPSEIAKVTAAEAELTLEPLRDMSYGQGFNCLDYAWEAMRLLHWNGQIAMIARLDLEPDPDHAVVIIPTTDEGWIFIEPQTGTRIYPTPGGKYVNFADIKDVYVMRLEWTLVDIYELSIAEGVVDTTALSYYLDD